VKKLENHLAIKDTNILRSALSGANIESSRGHVVIENTTVLNTNFGDGLVYNRIQDVVDFCSIIPDEASMPFVLKATGKIGRLTAVRYSEPDLGKHFPRIFGRLQEVNLSSMLQMKEHTTTPYL